MLNAVAKKKLSDRDKQKLNAKREQRKADLKTAKALRKQGIAFQGVNFRTEFTPSRQRRARKLSPIITGEWKALPIGPKARRAYREQERLTGKKSEDIFARPKGFFVVKNDPKFIKRFTAEGFLSEVQPLTNDMTIEKLSVPGGPGFRNVVRFLRSGEADKFKVKIEDFAFRFEEHASARIFATGRELAEFLEMYLTDEEQEAIESGESKEPKIHLYRVYPPHDWYRLVKLEAQDSIAEMTAEAKGLRGRELRRIKFSLDRARQKIGKLPSRIHQTSNQKRLSFIERERERDRKRRANEFEKRRKNRADRERIAAKRRAKREGK